VNYKIACRKTDISVIRKAQQLIYLGTLTFINYGICGVAELKNGLSYELASQGDWPERKSRPPH
jgi:hypothetical protein